MASSDFVPLRRLLSRFYPDVVTDRWTRAASIVRRPGGPGWRRQLILFLRQGCVFVIGGLCGAGRGRSRVLGLRAGGARIHRRNRRIRTRLRQSGPRSWRGHFLRLRLRRGGSNGSRRRSSVPGLRLNRGAGRRRNSIIDGRRSSLFLTRDRRNRDRFLYVRLGGIPLRFVPAGNRRRQHRSVLPLIHRTHRHEEILQPVGVGHQQRQRRIHTNTPLSNHSSVLRGLFYPRLQLGQRKIKLR